MPLQCWDSSGATACEPLSLEKVKVNLRIVAPGSSRFTTWNWSWRPPVLSPETCATVVAHRYDKQMSTAFLSVPFEALVSKACGYPTNTIKELFDGVIYTRLELCRQFQNLNQSKDEYKSVEQKLELLIPLAYWTVYTSIRNTDDDLLNPSDALTSIYLPIQNLLKRQDLPLIPMLQRLAILKVLHRKHILNGDDVLWKCLLSADFSFLNQISSQEPQDLAMSMTIENSDLFRKLCAADVDCSEESQTVLADMRSQLNKLVYNVSICLTALPELVKPVSEVAKDLLDARNFYTGIALLRGLREAGHCPQNLSAYWMLHDHRNNYAAYRAYYSKDPALPYLFPHILILRRARGKIEKGKILSELFQFVAYQGWSKDNKNNFDTDFEGATRTKTYQQSSKSDILLAWSKTVFKLPTTILVAIRQICASCLHPRKKPVQDIEKGVQNLHSTQIPYSKKVHLSVSNNMIRVMQNPRFVSVGSKFEFDIAYKEWKLLQSIREQAQQKLPRVERPVRKRIRVFCVSCKFNTGRSGGNCVKCGK